MATERTSELATENLHIFEARFGDQSGALALLEYPLKLREFFLRLSDKADLPDSAPAGVDWDPFIRGWPQDDYYIIALTEADRTAARPGMITTRMFAIPILQMAHWDSLAPIFQAIHETTCAYTPERSILLKRDLKLPTVSPSLLASAAHNLVNENKTVAVIGQREFEALVCTLWRKLPTSLRLTFCFGFSFTPADLIVSRCNLVAVPESCKTRWSSYKLKCDDTWEHPLSDSTSALLNEEIARNLLNFLREVGLNFNSLTDYGRYMRLWDYWQKRLENNFHLICALLRSLGTMLPDPAQAPRHKEEAAGILAAMLENSEPEDILALRTIKASSLATANTVIGSALSKWIKRQFHSTSPNKGEELAEIILASSTSHSEEWQIWVRSGLRDALSNLDEDSTNFVWNILAREGTFVELSAQLPTDIRTENLFVRTIPNPIQKSPYINLLLEWSINHGWIDLMAILAHSSFGYSKAMDLVLVQGNVSRRSKAIQSLCAAAKPEEIWKQAFKSRDTELLNCAAKAARTVPSLWMTDIQNIERWAELLNIAVQVEPSLLKSIDSDAIINRLYEAWEDSSPITEEICVALEQAGRLQFVNHRNRSQLWPKLPERFLPIALRNTLDAWLENYYSSSELAMDLEKDLVDILFETEHISDTFPSHSPMLGHGGLGLLRKWGTAPVCEVWLNALLASSVDLDSDIAHQAGELVKNRQWGIAAKAARAIDEQLGRRDFRPIWEIYYESLNSYDRFVFDYFLHTSPPTILRPLPVQLTSMFRVIIVTALPEEFTAIKKHLTLCREQVENGTIYEVGLFPANGTKCSVAVVQTGMGNAVSAAATERALSVFKPHFAFFVGIAGGLRDDLKIGDVIAANKVYSYESGKSGERFQPRPEAPPVSHEAEQRASSVARAKDWHKRIIPRTKTKPTAIVKPIAAGEKVLTSMSSEDMRRLKETFSDAYAVAMEDYGFSVAVHKHTSVCFSVVRGISDLIEGKQAADQAGSHEVAARNAAAFTFEMLAGLVHHRLKESPSTS